MQYKYHVWANFKGGKEEKAVGSLPYPLPLRKLRLRYFCSVLYKLSFLKVWFNFPVDGMVFLLHPHLNP